MNNYVITFIISLLINVLSASLVYAQYSGGSQTGSAEATIGSDIFTGGAQTGTISATSGSNGSLSHGDATHISFLVSPSSIAHSEKFDRQPVVVVLDANNNVVTGDNTTSITIAIEHNPGAGVLFGTKVITAVNGVARFTDLMISKAGQMYTFRAEAVSLGSAVSENFDIFTGTGPKFTAMWDSSNGGYYIYSWLESDGKRKTISADGCSTNYTITGPGYSTSLNQPDAPDANKCGPSDKWVPPNNKDTYYIDLSIYDATEGLLSTYSPLDISAMQLAYAGANWDNLAAL